MQYTLVLIYRKFLGWPQVQTTGDSVTRDTFKANVLVLQGTIEELGSRVGVDLIAMHIRAFYDLMQVDVSGDGLICDIFNINHKTKLCNKRGFKNEQFMLWIFHPIVGIHPDVTLLYIGSVVFGSGPIIHAQSWVLRRCLSLFNLIVRKGCYPRDPEIRRLFKALDMEVPGSSREDLDDGDDSGFTDDGEGSSSDDDDENDDHGPGAIAACEGEGSGGEGGEEEEVEDDPEVKEEVCKGEDDEMTGAVEVGTNEVQVEKTEPTMVSTVERASNSSAPRSSNLWFF